MKRIFAVMLCGVLLLAGCGAEEAAEEPIVGGSSASAQEEEPEKGSVEAAAEILDGQGTHLDPELDASADVIEIREKLFIAQTNEIYLNYRDYLGKTITYEGIYMQTELPDYEPWNYVVRFGPGCCTADDTAGFEVKYDGEWPEQMDWVEVVGVLETYDINGWDMLVLNVSSMTVKEERGAEYVTT